MPVSVTPFLMFQNGQAEPAMGFYAEALGADIEVSERFGAETPGAEGQVKRGSFTLAGQTVRVFDSPVKHAFGFTPAASLFIACRSADELDALAGKLSEGGEYLMGIGDYGFSKRFAWLNDRFGVSWQLNLE